MKKVSNEKYFLGILFIAILFSLSIIFGIIPQGSNKINISQAESIAFERVENSFQYKEYNGSNIQIIEKSQLGCQGCFNIGYRFDINNKSQELPDNIRGFKMVFSFVNGEIKNTSLSEIYFND